MNPFDYTLAELRKAIFAALLALITGLAAVTTDSAITMPEWFFLAGEVLAAFGIVFAVPNASSN